jgi:hypothetical protein
VILVQEDVDITGVLDQAHRLRGDRIQYIGQIQAGGEIDAEFLERVQLVRLLFEGGEQHPVTDQLPGDRFDTAVSAGRDFFQRRGKNIQQLDKGFPFAVGCVVPFQGITCLCENSQSEIAHTWL